MRPGNGKESQEAADVFGSIKHDGQWFVTANGCPVGKPLERETAKFVEKWLQETWPEINPGKG